MPVFDFHCKCGKVRKDKFFFTIKAAEEPFACEACGEPMEKDIPRFQYESFKTFTTRNIRKDGKPVTITSKNQLAQVMRENHVVPHPHNDTVEAKADYREIGHAVKEERAKFPARYRKLKEEVKALGIDQVTPIEAQARQQGVRNQGITLPG